MNSNIKLVYRVSKRAARRIAKGQLKYKERGILKNSYYVARYAAKNGPRAFVTHLKQEIVKIDRRLGNNLYFPNGLVSGVDKSSVQDWYEAHAKPVTLVIPSYNDLNVLVPCLQSIAKTTDPKLVKVIVVDDYCQPQNRKKLEKLENDQVKVIYRDKNGGFAKAVNTGLKAANRKYDVVLVNSDIIAHPDWLAGLQYGAYEFGVDTGIVGPKLLYPDGKIQSAGSHRNTEQPQWFDHYYRFQDSNYGPANVPQYCLGVTGACMYIKREFIDYVGLLDEGFQFAFEDMDWCIRGWEAGYRTLYFPSAVLTHVESATRGKNKQMSAKEKQSIKYFWSKWGDWFDSRNVKAASGKTRIIFVLQTFGLSGGIKNIFELANRLCDKGFMVEIWGIDNHGTPWQTHKDLKVRTFKNYDRLITRLSSEEAIKVATWWETAFPVWLSSVKKGVPVYFVSEFETWFYPDDIVAQSAVISCYRREFRNITICSYNQDELKTIGLNSTIIPCGYDYDTYKPLKDISRMDNVLLAVGRRFFQKNFEMTFKGWKLLGDKRPKMQLYGFEPELKKLDEKIDYRVKPSNEEVNKLYNEATMFVQTSRHEGFCLPILEAMAAGAPVICTDAHGNRDFCFDGKNCLMVEQDDAEGLSKAINKLLKSPKLRNQLSAQGLNTAKKYRWDVVAVQAEKFFKEVK